MVVYFNIFHMFSYWAAGINRDYSAVPLVIPTWDPPGLPDSHFRVPTDLWTPPSRRHLAKLLRKSEVYLRSFFGIYGGK